MGMDHMILGSYPVSVWRPAPMVERSAPISTIHLVGQANRATASAPELSPNLKRRRKRRRRSRKRRRRRRRRIKRRRRRRWRRWRWRSDMKRSGLYD